MDKGEFMTTWEKLLRRCLEIKANPIPGPPIVLSIPDYERMIGITEEEYKAFIEEVKHLIAWKVWQ